MSEYGLTSEEKVGHNDIHVYFLDFLHSEMVPAGGILDPLGTCCSLALIFHGTSVGPCISKL